MAIKIASKSDPNRFYYVTFSPSGLPYCTCPAWQYHTKPDKFGRKVCKHAAQVMPAQQRRPKVAESEVKWVQRFCPKCRARRYVLALFGLRCLRCGTETEA